MRYTQSLAATEGAALSFTRRNASAADSLVLLESKTAIGEALETWGGLLRHHLRGTLERGLGLLIDLMLSMSKVALLIVLAVSFLEILAELGLEVSAAMGLLLVAATVSSKIVLSEVVISGLVALLETSLVSTASA